MAKAEKNLNCQEVDEAASITGDLKIAYDAYKAAQKVAADKRREFEEAFIAQARKKKPAPAKPVLRTDAVALECPNLLGDGVKSGQRYCDIVTASDVIPFRRTA